MFGICFSFYYHHPSFFPAVRMPSRSCKLYQTVEIKIHFRSDIGTFSAIINISPFYILISWKLIFFSFVFEIWTSRERLIELLSWNLGSAGLNRGMKICSLTSSIYCSNCQNDPLFFSHFSGLIYAVQNRHLSRDVQPSRTTLNWARIDDMCSHTAKILVFNCALPTLKGHRACRFLPF
jgi:hypothetical protein